MPRIKSPAITGEALDATTVKSAWFLFHLNKLNEAYPFTSSSVRIRLHFLLMYCALRLPIVFIVFEMESSAVGVTKKWM